MTERRLSLTRLRINAQGYDHDGSYWGAGPDVFIAVTADRTSEITVRAANAREARSKAATELARKAGTPVPKQALGGKSPHITRYETSWRHPLDGTTHKLAIRHSRDYLASGQDHLEIISATKKEPHPLSDTGYRSEFVPALALMNAGGPVTYVNALVARALTDRKWLTRESARAQGDLFAWAAAQAETSKRRTARPRRPKAGAAPAAKKDRSP